MYSAKKEENIKTLAYFSSLFESMVNWGENDKVLDISLTKGALPISVPNIVSKVKKITTVVAKDEDIKWIRDKISPTDFDKKVDLVIYDSQQKLKEEYDIVTFYSSLHHAEPMEILKFANMNLKNSGQIIVFDGFFPTPLRDIYSILSKIAEPSNFLHLTYHEVIRAMRENGFNVKTILPIYFRRPLTKTLSTFPDNIRKTVEQLFKFNKCFKEDMGLGPDENGSFYYYYDLFMLVGVKETPMMIVMEE